MAVKYPEIKQYILERIEDRSYQEGQMLPTERELTAFFDASRMTIRRALDELVQDGIVVRRRGSGVFVAKEKLTRSMQRVSIHDDEEIVKKFGSIHVKVIDMKIVKNHPSVSRLLQLEDAQEIWQLKRVQYAGKTPIVYENIFLPTCYFKDISNVDCSQSMSRIVKQTLMIQTDKEERKISVEAMLATAKIGKYLEITKGSPILQLNIVVYHDGKPMYCGMDSYDGSSFIYQAD